MLNISLFMKLKVIAAGNESGRIRREKRRKTMPPSYAIPPHAMNHGYHQLRPRPNGMSEVCAEPGASHTLSGWQRKSQSSLHLATKPKKYLRRRKCTRSANRAGIAPELRRRNRAANGWAAHGIEKRS